MKTRLIPFVLSLQLAILSGVHAEEFNKEKAVAEAKSITQSFAAALKNELVTAMKSGGPINALGVCNAEAMPITSGIATEKDAQISRVSLKNRNPDNVPNDWQKAVLMDFDTRAANGEDVAKMAAVTVVEHNGKQQLRFMKAVPTSGECLACHGQQLNDEIQAKLEELYPDDKATGYSLGDVRGAIVVVKEY